MLTNFIIDVHAIIIILIKLKYSCIFIIIVYIHCTYLFSKVTLILSIKEQKHI